MKDCLVTTSKVDVGDNSLEFLGGMVVHFAAQASPSISNRTLTLSRTVEKAIIINNPSGTCYFTNFDTSANYGDEITEGNGIIPVGTYGRLIEVAGTGECDIVIFTKYGIADVNCNNNKIKVTSFTDIGAATENGTVFYIYYNNDTQAVQDVGESISKAKIAGLHLFGTISSKRLKCIEYLSDTTKFVTLELYGMKLSADEFTKMCSFIHLTTLLISSSSAVPNFSVGEFAKMTALTKIEVTDITTTFGAIENFVIAQRALGRTSCAGISWKYAGYLGCTFNGTAVAKNANAMTLIWTATTITFNGVTINA